ncbi:MAG: tRNA (adenosine(37)-N6)-dimethylallyltransferase MiaA [Bacteroidaceae bacterium]|nr:tRNA (adenosine(37)-N6)-dimethylallyltransferase MiaA [Bacteroidaceae bacterium]MBR5149607.1 tRNA (adenosine(37)-N6)-dimethylallyltransferase MiaA [Bacteroidaceae bacterium]
MKSYNLVTILGPTACGKTTLAVALADRLSTAVISADSRQVYRSMDLGTGKDLGEYVYEGRNVPYHLIDIVDAGYKYNVFEYQRDFLNIFEHLRSEGQLPVMCGGTGMYLESVLRGYRLVEVPENKPLRESLEGKSIEELTAILQGYKQLHNTTDVDTCKRAIRAIEIEEYYRTSEANVRDFPQISSLTIGLDVSRELRRERITRRLHERLQQGMVDEVRGILASGVAPEDLIYYGLEYKYLTMYIIGELTYDEMVSQLEIAIHQFAKRQMTYFRGMERRGVPIHWIDASLSTEEKVESIVRMLNAED